MQQQAQNPDTKIYQHIIQKQNVPLGQIKPISATTSVLLHLLFKGIVLMLFYFDRIFTELTSQIVLAQLIIIFVVIDFWFTKNVNGRRLLGTRWFFCNDKFGQERFAIQTRINIQYVNPVNSKLFWIIQLGYVIVPAVDITTTIIISPNIYRVQWDKVFVNLVVIAGALSNFFLFFKATSTGMERVMEFRRQYNDQFLKKLGPNSLVTYL